MTDIARIWLGIAALFFIAIAPSSCVALQGINSSLKHIAIKECGK